MNLPGFVNVPVPEHLVTAVMRFIADETSSESPASEARARQPNGESAGSRDWTREQFQLLRSSDAPSVKLFCRVLTVLAEQSPAPMNVQAIGDRVGVEGLTMQKKFGAVTKWIQNPKHIGADNRWPIHFPAEGGWSMNAHNAALWLEVVTH